MELEVGNIVRLVPGPQCSPSHNGSCNHSCYISLTNRRPLVLNLNSQRILEILNNIQNPETRSHFTERENARVNRTRK